MYGVEFAFPVLREEDEEQKANIQKVLDWILARPWIHDYCSFSVWDNETCNSTRHIIIKCGWEQADSAERLFGRRTKSVSVRRYEVCQHENCYKQSMAYGKDVMLFRNEVETTWPYEIHEYCVVHERQQYSRQIARTIETTVETAGRIWEKIFSFQIDKQFWSQRVTLVDEGDYEMGEQIASYPTPWVGPFIKREQAIQAARDYKE